MHVSFFVIKNGTLLNRFFGNSQSDRDNAINGRGRFYCQLQGIEQSAGIAIGNIHQMGAGISICQPTLAALVRHWFAQPRDIARATGVWSNGLLVGELLSASLTLPLILAGVFAISYSTAFLTTLVTGAVWDATGIEASAFLPALLGSVIVAVLGPSLVAAAVEVRN